MKRSRKSNRVSWAPGSNLCQVKLFLSDDYPSKVGLKSQDNLKGKASSMLCSSSNEYVDLPPGFESSHFPNQSKAEFSHIPKIKWECPLPFVFSSAWLVAAGEESREIEIQKLREIRVLEAVYPRHSAIPPSPSVSLDVKEEDYNDNLTPLIPLIPVEEEESMEAAVNPQPNGQSQNLHKYMSAPTSSCTISSDACVMPLAGVSSGSVADIAAASDVVAAILKSKEQGGLIDMDLLVKILNDLKMIENLISEHGSKTATSNSVVTSTSGLKAATPSVPMFTPTPDAAASRNTHPSSVGFSGLKPSTPSVSSLNHASGKPATLFAPAIPSYSIVTSAYDKTATALVPLSRPVSGKPASPSVFMPTPSPASHMPRPVNNDFHVSNGMPTALTSQPVNNAFHMSNGMPTALNSQPRPDSFLASGANRSASFTFASISSSEQNTVPLPPSTGNLHAVLNHTQTTASTNPYQTSTGSASSVKDVDYYKNLIRQHGADGHDMLDSQIAQRGAGMVPIAPFSTMFQLSQELFAEICAAGTSDVVVLP
ncbi:zinc finger CCCH domain-containing protein [Trifolium repens]|nr:zinc finger CCCH domain-containing protein [Trifolium repens]